MKKTRRPSTKRDPWRTVPERTAYRLTITKEAHDAIRSAADPVGGLDGSTTEFLEDGRARILISPETFDRLARVAHRGETPSDAIIRVVALAATGGRPQ